jgi:hypothetical protein
LLPYAEGLKNWTEKVNKSDSAVVVEVDRETFAWAAQQWGRTMHREVEIIQANPDILKKIRSMQDLLVIHFTKCYPGP